MQLEKYEGQRSSEDLGIGNRGGGLLKTHCPNKMGLTAP